MAQKYCTIPQVWCGKGPVPNNLKYSEAGTPFQCLRKGFGAGSGIERNKYLPSNDLHRIPYLRPAYIAQLNGSNINTLTDLRNHFVDLTRERQRQFLERVTRKLNGEVDTKAYDSILNYLHSVYTSDNNQEALRNLAECHIPSASLIVKEEEVPFRTTPSPLLLEGVEEEEEVPFRPTTTAPLLLEEGEEEEEEEEVPLLLRGEPVTGVPQTLTEQLAETGRLFEEAREQAEQLKEMQRKHDVRRAQSVISPEALRQISEQEQRTSSGRAQPAFLSERRSGIEPSISLQPSVEQRRLGSRRSLSASPLSSPYSSARSFEDPFALVGGGLFE